MTAGPAPRRAMLLVAMVSTLFAGCEPQARRALLLDLSLTDPALLDGTARPWHDAGYTVEYRRYFPHLTQSDVDRYHVLLLLFRDAPSDAVSDGLSGADFALLDEWLAHGGVAVLAYAADAPGSADRAAANRWLAAQGVGIAISDSMLEDTTVRSGWPQAPPWAEGVRVGDDPMGSVYEPFPLDRNHLLHVRRASEILAVTGRHTFVRTARAPAPAPGAVVVAASRVSDGLVIVMSREGLGALGPQTSRTTAPLLQLDALSGTRDFLTAVARWTRRPAEWAHVPPAQHRTRDQMAAVLAIDAAPTRAAAPTGVPVESLPAPLATASTATGIPDWIRQSGMRALWTPLLASRDGPPAARSAASLDSIVGFLDEAGLNLLIGDARPDVVGDSLHHHWEDRLAVRHAWTSAVAVLQPTSVAWVPALDLRGYRPQASRVDSGAHAQVAPPSCNLDSTLWNAALAPEYVTLARLAGGLRQLVPALAFDLTPTPGAAAPTEQDFCDVAWHRALLQMGQRGPMDSIPLPERYHALRDAGLLPKYYRALEDAVADRARGIRDRVLKERAGLYFAFRFERAPSDWFAMGLLRGFSLPDRPLLLFTPEVQTRQLLERYRSRGIDAVHAVELPAAVVRVPNLSALKRISFLENDGFWLSLGEGPVSRTGAEGARSVGDSLAQALRRLAR